MHQLAEKASCVTIRMVESISVFSLWKVSICLLYTSSQEVCVQTGNSTVLKDLDVDYGDDKLNEQAKRAAASTAESVSYTHLI